MPRSQPRDMSRERKRGFPTHATARARARARLALSRRELALSKTRERFVSSGKRYAGRGLTQVPERFPTKTTRFPRNLSSASRSSGIARSSCAQPKQTRGHTCMRRNVQAYLVVQQQNIHPSGRPKIRPKILPKIRYRRSRPRFKEAVEGVVKSSGPRAFAEASAHPQKWGKWDHFNF